MKPIGNQVMVKLRKVDDKTTGGLFVPTAEIEKPKEGVVVLAGPGAPHPDTGEVVPRRSRSWRPARCQEDNGFCALGDGV